MNNDLIHILLVEDNPIDVMAFERALEKQKIANPLLRAKDGLEALEMLRGEGGHDPVPQPHIIVLDLNMPRMNGIELLDEIRQDEQLKQSIVFVLTTSEDDQDKTRAYNRQIAGYMSKNDMGYDFLQVIQLLEQFRIAIHFPPGSPE